MIFEIVFFSLFSIILSLLILAVQRKSFDFNRCNMEIKGYGVLIITAAIKVAAQFLFKKYPNSTLLSVLSVNWILYIALLYVSILNIKSSYGMLFFMGTLFNFIAIIANGFKMPVYIDETLLNADVQKIILLSGKDLIHSLLTENTKFKFLCDIITLRPPYPFPKTISVGDIFLLSGIFSFWQDLFFENAKYKNAKYKNAKV